MPPKPPPKATATGKSARSRPPAKPKAPLPDAERALRLYRALCAQIDGAHLANALKTCDKLLRLDSGDGDAAQTRRFLLLHTERYAAALPLCEDAAHAYERAYALYRLQREQDARTALAEVGPDGERGVRHLEAQMAYRSGQYDAALEAYTQLLDSAEPNSEEHADILTNLRAAQAHADFLSSGYLSAVDALPAGDLEGAPPPLPASTAPPSAAAPTSAPKGAKKVRLPKGVVPGGPPPDPERWLKKRERSTFVQRKRRGGGGGGGGASQGVVLTDVPAPAPAPAAAAGKKGKKKK